MEYIIIGIGVAVVATICVTAFLKRKMTKESRDDSVFGNTAKSEIITAKEKSSQEFFIQMETISAETITDESKLVEVTDHKVLGYVNNLIPGLAQVGNAVNNAVQALQTNGEVLYRAIIPAGAKLADSQDMEGAVRGIYHGTESIRGHANWVTAEAHKGTTAVANTAAAAMGVASMVVGQYYMTQINAKLDQVNVGLSKIIDFHNDEYRSRVFALTTHVKAIAVFQLEIIENDELRASKIHQLDSLDEECTKLLGQANLTLLGYAKKKELEYETYEKELKEAQNWYMYQKTLLDVLYRISDLRYTLHLGGVSRQQCTALLPTYIKQVDDSQARLTNWHQETVKRLNIDTSEARRKRAGFDGVVHFLPGLIKDEFNFRTIDKSTADMIDEQANSNCKSQQHDVPDLYFQDVQLIAKDGKVYYLPEYIVE